MLEDAEKMPPPHRVAIRQISSPDLSLRSQELCILEVLLCVVRLLFL